MRQQAPSVPRRRRRRWIVGAAALLVVLAALALAPTLLSTRALRPALEFLLRQRCGVPVDVEAATLRWLAPSTFTRTTLGSPPGFADKPLFHAEEVVLGTSLLSLLTGRSPLSLSLSGATLSVIRAPGGKTNLGESLGAEGRTALRRALSAPLRVVARQSALEVSDRESGQTSFLSQADLEWAMAQDGSRVIAGGGLIEGPQGTGALRLRFAVEGEGDTRCASLDLAARNLSLAGFSPLLGALVEGAALEGQLDLDLNGLLGPGRRADVAGQGTVRGLLFAAAPWVTGAPVADSLITIAGGCSIDLDRRQAVFDSFRLSSSLLDVDARGSISISRAGFAGDLEGRAGINLGRAAFKARPLAFAVLPVQTIGGDVEISFRPGANGAMHVALSGEGLASQLTRERSLGLGETYAETDVNVFADPFGVALEGLFFSTRFLEVEGRGMLRLAQDGSLADLACDLRFTGEEAHVIHEFLMNLRLAPPMLVAGGVDLRLRADAGAEEVACSAAFESQDFDLRYAETSGGIEDNYFFRGRPLSARLRVSWPRRASAPAAALSGTLSLSAPGAAIQRNEFTDFRLDAALEDGVVRLERCSGAFFGGGRVEATGSLETGGAARPRLRLRATGSDLALKAFPAALAGAATAVFAAEGGCWKVKSTARLSGQVEVEGVGRGLSEWLSTMTGAGRLDIGSGEVEGSTLLERLRAPAVASGSRRIEGISAGISFQGGMLRAEPVKILLADRTFVMAGDAHWSGKIHFVVPASSIFDNDFIERHGAAWPSDIFQITGSIDAPRLRLPDASEWIRKAGEGCLDEAIQNLFTSGS
ncbi:MAG: hypothetical protein HY812_06380 [Planctomycetes bacterium]|nr:hypothetical protein [Planctomycetota bacterium]